MGHSGLRSVTWGISRCFYAIVFPSYPKRNSRSNGTISGSLSKSSQNQDGSGMGCWCSACILSEPTFPCTMAKFLMTSTCIFMRRLSGCWSPLCPSHDGGLTSGMGAIIIDAGCEYKQLSLLIPQMEYFWCTCCTQFPMYPLGMKLQLSTVVTDWTMHSLLASFFICPFSIPLPGLCTSKLNSHHWSSSQALLLWASHLEKGVGC